MTTPDGPHASTDHANRASTSVLDCIVKEVNRTIERREKLIEAFCRMVGMERAATDEADLATAVDAVMPLIERWLVDAQAEALVQAADECIGYTLLLHGVVPKRVVMADALRIRAAELRATTTEQD